MKFFYALALAFLPIALIEADCEQDCKKAEESCLKLPLPFGTMCEQDYNRCARLCQTPTKLAVNQSNARKRATL